MPAAHALPPPKSSLGTCHTGISCVLYPPETTQAHTKAAVGVSAADEAGGRVVRRLVVFEPLSFMRTALSKHSHHRPPLLQVMRVADLAAERDTFAPPLALQRAHQVKEGLIGILRSIQWRGHAQRRLLGSAQLDGGQAVELLHGEDE